MAYFLLAGSALSMPIRQGIQSNKHITSKRDGNTEFDTDLCLLKRGLGKRAGIIGEGINNCDF